MEICKTSDRVASPVYMTIVLVIVGPNRVEICTGSDCLISSRINSSKLEKALGHRANRRVRAGQEPRARQLISTITWLQSAINSCSATKSQHLVADSLGAGAKTNQLRKVAGPRITRTSNYRQLAQRRATTVSARKRLTEARSDNGSSRRRWWVCLVRETGSEIS